MRRGKNRFGNVLFGVLIGILISVSILWWMGNNPFKDMHYLKGIKSYFTEIFPSSAGNHEIDTEEKNTETSGKIIIKKKSYTQVNADSAYFDTTNIDFYDQNALDEFLALYGGKLPDSIKIDSVFKNQKIRDNSDVLNTDNSSEIKKDKLLYVLSYRLPDIGQLAGNTADKADSLLIESAANKNENNILKVEFWKSPVNYKGYKTGRNKVIVFGINPGDKVFFKVLNKVLYMKHHDLFYQIDFSYEFKSFTPITNAQIISQLNK